MIAWLLALCALAQDDVQPAPAATRVTASVVVAVTQREQAADVLVDAAEELGGWFQSRTPTALSLRVPVENVDTLIEVAAEQGKVVDRGLTREDVGRQIAEVRGRLEAREEVLERYYEVLEQAGAKSIVAVERQIVDAITQIEALKGQLRLLEDQAAYGRVEVAFQFRDRAAPARDGTSSFRWLNTLNVQDVVWGMQSGRPDWRSRGVYVPQPPDGFSAWRRMGRYRAASPDAVLFRVRSVRHEPRAELSFWKEAVRERMVAAGYTVQAESDIAAGEAQGGLLELAAPLGTEDWTYLIAFFPDGRRLIVAEAAGEISELDARRDAVVEAIRQLEI